MNMKTYSKKKHKSVVLYQYLSISFKILWKSNISALISDLYVCFPFFNVSFQKIDTPWRDGGLTSCLVARYMQSVDGALNS